MEQESHKYDGEWDVQSQKFAAIGLTADEFSVAVKALRDGDAETIDALVQTSITRIESEGMQVLTTQEQYLDKVTQEYLPERDHFHAEILTDVFRGNTPVENPTLTILAGPPGVGKSWYKAMSGEFTNTVQTDPDGLKRRLLLGYNGIDMSHILATHEESLDIAQMILGRALEQDYSVLLESTLRHPDWVRATVNQASEHGFDSQLVFLHRPLVDCFTDAMTRSERPISLPFLMSSIEGYENAYDFWHQDLFASIRGIDITDRQTPVLIESAERLLPILNSVTSLRTSEYFK